MSSLESVFGEGVKLDAAGKPIETGIGALKAELHKLEKAVGTELIHIIDPALVKENADLKTQVANLQSANKALTDEVMSISAEVAAMTAKLQPETVTNPVPTQAAPVDPAVANL